MTRRCRFTLAVATLVAVTGILSATVSRAGWSALPLPPDLWLPTDYYLAGDELKIGTQSQYEGAKLFEYDFATQSWTSQTLWAEPQDAGYCYIDALGDPRNPPCLAARIWFDDAGDMYSLTLERSQTLVLADRYELTHWDGSLLKRLALFSTSDSDFVHDVAGTIDSLYVAGTFEDSTFFVQLPRVAHLVTDNWTFLGTFSDSDIARVSTSELGLFASGNIDRGVVQWTGTEWEPAKGGVDTGEGGVPAMLADSGDLLIGGRFAVGGPAVPNVAQLSENGWTSVGGQVGTRPDAIVTVVARAGDGRLFAATETQVFVWDGSAWRLLGGAASGGPIRYLLAGSSKLVVAGAFTSIAGMPASGIATWSLKCGNGVIDEGEECDDGNYLDDDACVNGCIRAVCGDGYVFAGVEQCDDSNFVNGDGCDADCTLSPPYAGCPVAQVAAGNGHACALDVDGRVFCWGDNSDGQSTPPQGRFIYIASYYGTCGIGGDGSITCWGSVPEPPTGAFTQLSIGPAGACGVRTDQTLQCWDSNGSQPPQGTFLQVSVGKNVACAVRDDQTVACWGSNVWGEGSPPSGAFQQVAVATGDNFTCGLRMDGTIDCWGQGSDAIVSHPGPFTQVAVGGYHACGLRDDGNLECWGRYDAVRSIPDGPFTQVSAGTHFSCALRPNKTVVCWGRDDQGQTAAPICTACGNGLVQKIDGEQCDDGNTVAGDGCASSCTLEACGDGIVNDSGLEQCDDGNTASGDGCDANCTLTACGNGIVTAAEQCDDGDSVYHFGDRCDAACQSMPCAKPVSGRNRVLPTATDAQWTLRTSVGSSACDLAICDVDGDGHVYASDALRILRAAVGLLVTLSCPP